MSRFDNRIVKDQSVTFWHQDSRGSGVTFRHQDSRGSGVTNRHVVVGDRSVTFRHQDSKMNEYWGDRSVTFRHQDSKENESWIMLIYSGLKNLIPKWVWCGGLNPHRYAWVVINDPCTCCCHLLRILVDFMLLSDIYCFLFWLGQWYLLRTCALYWPLLVCFFLCYL